MRLLSWRVCHKLGCFLNGFRIFFRLFPSGRILPNGDGVAAPRTGLLGVAGLL